jgi:flap endonuclease-1
VGIDLGDVVVRNPTRIPELAGQRLAFDAWNILYQFLASIRTPDGSPLKDREGHVTSHLMGIMTRTGALVEAGVKPVFVFDGPPHPLKARTLGEREARKTKAQADYDTALQAAEATADEDEKEAHMVTARTKAQQTSRLTLPMVAEAQELLRGLGIPVVLAPGEGEAQASWMAHTGLVDAAVSQDFDALLFGTPSLVRNLSTGGRRKLPGRQVWVDVEPERIPLAESLAHAACDQKRCKVHAEDPTTADPTYTHVGLSREQLIDAALLVGTDFHPGVKGIGAKKATAAIAKAGNLEALRQRIADTAPEKRSAMEKLIADQGDGAFPHLDEVRRIFREPAHVPVQADALGLRPPDPAAVKDLLVTRHGFGLDRVEAALAKFGAARGRAAQKTLF